MLYKADLFHTLQKFCLFWINFLMSVLCKSPAKYNLHLEIFLENKNLCCCFGNCLMRKLFLMAEECPCEMPYDAWPQMKQCSLKQPLDLQPDDNSDANANVANGSLEWMELLPDEEDLGTQLDEDVEDLNCYEYLKGSISVTSNRPELKIEFVK
ncbi:hypothetical protein ZIOFF_055455 [Zingiber officinale]|uniref:Uncharacterized protein n=1 Tax=Zingiber officinale TaxID=94328 RepID=A0A8J5KQ00_ZINOF|nr:hypothetical protein ZIOFF_055455 [Zingiber officinale]